VSLSRRHRRILHQIERDLAASDPGLSQFFLLFNWRAWGHRMPRAERVVSWPLRVLVPRWHGRTVTERVKDWCAENWTDS
jgi:hypothetical protein